jgi:P pilus assembly chaperone PapD
MNITLFQSKRLWLAALVLALSPITQAGLLLDQSIVIFDEAQVRADVRVLNDSNENKLFASVEPFLVTSPGEENEELVPLSSLDDPEFIVTPNKLIIEPGSNGIVRLLNMAEPAQTDVIYRVNFTPIEKPLELQRADDGDATRTGVQIVLAYQALVIIPPPEPKAIPEVTRSGKSVIFANSGNSNYKLTNGLQCNPQDPSDCRELIGARVYAGNKREVQLPFDGPLQFNMQSVAGRQVLAVP